MVSRCQLGFYISISQLLGLRIHNPSQYVRRLGIIVVVCCAAIANTPATRSAPFPTQLALAMGNSIVQMAGDSGDRV